MTGKPGDEIVRLTTARNLQEAHLWKQALEQEGIRCQVVGDYLTEAPEGVHPFCSELWVFGNDVEKAKAILGKSQQGAGDSQGNRA